MAESILLQLKREDCVYTKCYCEENIWKLCDSIRKSNLEVLPHLSVVFISNKTRSIPIWKQRSAKSEELPVIWDYHVILLYLDQNCSKHMIFDLDSSLAFPTEALEYCSKAFCPQILLKIQYQQFFKVIPADEYLKNFASDRSHMMLEDNKWSSDPPDYPPISTESSSMNLDDFISMDFETNKFGAIYSLSEFMKIV
uniref:protein N-terminal glutamine amidohydrolase n=1 Tax=Ciona intestinalis TaxID=7719 RepID=UPI000180C7C3|nr:protein N-terminal glutamine amidohydrolase [Ciona intestinalis]|eukprot:XP_002122600.1 protein N-terminal glutamine amidohydrolase [Ciona intestinalis]